MTHPSDQVYRFRSLAHWGRGHAEGLVFGTGDDASLSTLTNLEAHLWAEPQGDTDIVGFGFDVGNRLIWMTSDGGLWAWSNGFVVLLARVAQHLADNPIAIIWGQLSGWIASADSLHRIDVKTGDRTGNFARRDWRTVGVVPDKCDGVIVLELHNSGAPYELRQIRSDGVARQLPIKTELCDVVAMARRNKSAPLQIVDIGDADWRVLALTIGDDEPRISTFHLDKDRRPTANLTMDGPHRLAFVTQDGAIFSASHGVLEPAQKVHCVGPVVDLTHWNGALFAATATGVYRVDAEPLAGAAQLAHYLSPVLHSPPGDTRSGWQRADLMADMPEGAQIRIRSRSFDNPYDVADYQDMMRNDPGNPMLKRGWDEEWASVHNGVGSPEIARHYLGADKSDDAEEKRPYIALRIDISVPACVTPVRLTGLDVFYPDRSLIEELPDIYQTGDAGETKFRRMLAPMQALADEINDLIGSTLVRIDPEQTDALWAGFLLSWLGHGGFVGLPEDLRKSLLSALPDVLPRRGTMTGLRAALTALAPDGFSVEDPSRRPDLWVLPIADDPNGARLGCDTATVGHHPQALQLDDCCGPPLGLAVLERSCLDPALLTQPCSTELVIRFYGASAEDRIGPFADRIARHFLPANTRARFEFGGSPKGRRLGDDPNQEDGNPLIVLDQGTEQEAGRWALPRVGPGTERQTETVEAAVLDGTLILK
ncbi:hypothetical protein [Ruegeria meonggei]|uniref:hypothetical protein n=1 Tax=Ruegeria meonggei TaxID=1446476 RepID=UPI003670D3EB